MSPWASRPGWTRSASRRLAGAVRYESANDLIPRVGTGVGDADELPRGSRPRGEHHQGSGHGAGVRDRRLGGGDVDDAEYRSVRTGCRIRARPDRQPHVARTRIVAGGLHHPREVGTVRHDRCGSTVNSSCHGELSDGSVRGGVVVRDEYEQLQDGARRTPEPSQDPPVADVPVEVIAGDRELRCVPRSVVPHQPPHPGPPAAGLGRPFVRSRHVRPIRHVDAAHDRRTQRCGDLRGIPQPSVRARGDDVGEHPEQEEQQRSSGDELHQCGLGRTRGPPGRRPGWCCRDCWLTGSGCAPSWRR